jgi:hypothetical protein
MRKIVTQSLRPLRAYRNQALARSSFDIKETKIFCSYIKEKEVNVPNCAWECFVGENSSAFIMMAFGYDLNLPCCLLKLCYAITLVSNIHILQIISNRG